MTDEVGPAFLARLHEVAAELTVDALRVEPAVRLAEDLLSAGWDGHATEAVGSLARHTPESEAKPFVVEMLAEHGIRVWVPLDVTDRRRLLLTAFAYWDLPIDWFEGRFYADCPPVADQTPLESALLVLADARDHETTPNTRLAIENEMRAVARRKLPLD